MSSRTCARLVAALLLSLAGALACAAPVARGGMLDLGDWRFDADGPVPLQGQWQFVSWRLVEPRDTWPANAAPIDVPGAWNTVLGSGQGMGTYRLLVACSAAGTLALAMPFQQDAAAVSVNGREVGRQGRPGLPGAGHQPEIAQRLLRLDGLSCPLDIRVQVSNGEFFRGGMLRTPLLGDARLLAERRESTAVLGVMLVGAILTVGVFSLLIYAVRRRGHVGLSFGLFCMNMALLAGLTGDRTLQPLVGAVPFGWHARILFANWYFAAAIYTLLLAQLFPRQANRTATRAITAFGFTGVALCLLLPPQVFIPTGPVVQASAVVVLANVVWTMARALAAREPGAVPLVAGLLVLVVSVVHELVFYQHLAAFSAMPFGLAAAVLTPAVLLAQRMARALSSEELRRLEQRERTDLLVRSTHAGLLDWDGIAGRAQYSARFCEMLGYDPERAQPPPLQQLLHPDEFERVNGSFLRQLRDRSVRDGVRMNEPIDFRMRRADGDYIWVHGEGISLCDATGRVLRFIGSFIDITDRVRHEEELARQVAITQRAREDLAHEQERLRLLVRATKAGFSDWDAQRDVITYTDRFLEMLGYPADTDTSAWPSLFEMMHPEDRDRAREEFRQMIRRRQPGEQVPGEPMSYRLRHAKGHYVSIHADGISLVDDTGRTRRFITSYLDVTQLREQEEQLRHSRDRIAAQARQLEANNEALREAVRVREEVERIARHDIKTPLNSIVAVPRLLREERRLGAEADELLGIVERAGYRILSMVNFSLDLYKMEQGDYVFRPDAVDIADLLDKVAADLRTHAASKRVRLRLDAAQAPYAWAEELLCYSLLANLLKNAIEASPEDATVSITASAQPADDRLQLRIHNAGAVPAHLRATFFEKYATSGKASGTGLGTYSAQLMARVQDGDIAMQSSEAQGTTLTVRLRVAPAGRVPATARHAQDRRTVDAQRMAGLPAWRVLLVDDDEYNLLILRRFLPAPPFTVVTAINGKLALGAAQAAWPDVVFMDLDMPVMGGLDAVRALREVEREGRLPRCTMLALSSHEDDETRRRALDAGFDRYLAKPVTREIVQDTLLELHERGRIVARSVVVRPPPPSLAGIDDPVDADPDLQPLLQDFLASRQRLVAQLLQALAAGERAEVRRLAHQLAGSFGLYGFEWASERSRWLEREWEGAELAAMQHVAQQLRRHLDTVRVRYASA